MSDEKTVDVVIHPEPQSLETQLGIIYGGLLEVDDRLATMGDLAAFVREDLATIRQRVLGLITGMGGEPRSEW